MPENAEIIDLWGVLNNKIYCTLQLEAPHYMSFNGEEWAEEACNMLNELTAIGTAKIYAVAADGSGCSDYVTLTVSKTVPVDSVELSNAGALEKGSSYQLSASINSSNSANNSVTWKSSNAKVATVEDAIQGAKYIIAEWISDNASYRKYIRNNIYNFGTIKSKLKKNAKDEELVYKMYYDYSEKIKYAKPTTYQK